MILAKYACIYIIIYMCVCASACARYIILFTINKYIVKHVKVNDRILNILNSKYHWCKYEKHIIAM